MRKYFNEQDGWTYFIKEGELYACPTNADNSLDTDNVCHVSDMTFERDLSQTKEMLTHIRSQLTN